MHQQGKPLRQAEENHRLDYGATVANGGGAYLDNFLGQKRSLPQTRNHGTLIRPQQLGGFYYGQRARKILGMDHG